MVLLIFIALGLACLALLFFGPLAPLARQKGEEPQTWRLMLLLAWGFIWVGERYAAVYWKTMEAVREHRWLLLLTAFLLSLVSYGVFYYVLRQKPDRNSWEGKLKEIGKQDDEEAS